MNKPWKNTSDIDLLTQMAITASTEASWEEAVKINQKILNTSKNNVEALNRLARAHICQGHFAEAKKTYSKVLDLDTYNIIAKKNMDRLKKADNKTIDISNLSNSNAVNHFTPNLTSLFLFEPGKTKVVNLLNLAPPSILAAISCGEEVHINPKRHSVAITTSGGIYIGALPDDLSHRLITFITGGNAYQAFVKSATQKSLTIFIREIRKSQQFESQPSFPPSPVSTKDEYLSY